MTLVFSVNMVYFVTIAGLNPLQMVLVGTSLEASIFLFEVPTGIVADTLSRRFSVIIGVFLIGLGFLIQALFLPFLWIILAQITWGVGFTFTSGALQAWITDEIGEDRAASAFLRAAQLEQAGSFAAILIGLILAVSFSLSLPMLLGGIFFCVLGLYLMMRMPETGFSPAAQVEENAWKTMRTTFSSGLKMLKIRPILFRILLIGFFYGFYSEGLDRLWVPHLLERFNLPDQGQGVMLGWIGGISLCSMAFTYFSAGVLRKKLGEQIPSKTLARSLILLSFFLISFIFALAFSKWLILSFLCLIIINIVRALIYPIYLAWINRRLDSSTRATVLSMGSLVDAVGQISGGPLSGLIANAYSLQSGLAASAILLSPVLVFLFQTRSTVNDD